MRVMSPAATLGKITSIFFAKSFSVLMLTSGCAACSASCCTSHSAAHRASNGSRYNRGDCSRDNLRNRFRFLNLFV
jgi:hypothetical protein